MRYLKFFVIYLIVLFNGCSNSTKPNLSFYFWRAEKGPNSKELNHLKQLNVKTLYQHLFDVDNVNGLVIPLGTISYSWPFDKSLEQIPVVFITNRTFSSLTKAQSDSLVIRILKKSESLLGSNFTSTKEFQIDCDWSDQTRDAYFSFLRTFKKKWHKKLSVTIRLHQVKYYRRTGVPPADEGVLMCYNIGKLGISTNSIYDTQTAKKYLMFLNEYPLKLKPALPIFNWILHFRNGRLIGLRSKSEIPKLNDSLSIFYSEEKKRYEIKKAFLYRGTFYEEKDELREEKVTKFELMEAAQLLKGKGEVETSEVLFYELDDYYLKNYTYEDFDEILSEFN